MNEIILLGRLTGKPTYKKTDSDLSIASFAIAIDRNGAKDKNEEKITDFPRVTVFGVQADNAHKYLDKGRLVLVKGHIQTGHYENETGDVVYTTSLIGDSVRYLDFSKETKDEKNEDANE